MRINPLPNILSVGMRVEKAAAKKQVAVPTPARKPKPF